MLLVVLDSRVHRTIRLWRRNVPLTVQLFKEIECMIALAKC